MATRHQRFASHSFSFGQTTSRWSCTCRVLLSGTEEATEAAVSQPQASSFLKH